MRRKQNGITFIGWLFLLIPVALVGYAVIRLTPVYLNYLKVSRSLDQVAKQFQGDNQVSVARVRNGLERRFDVESVSYPPLNSVLIAKKGESWTLESSYEDVVPMFAGISLLVKFHKTSTIQ